MTMSTKQKDSSGSFAVSIIFILCSIVLVLMFVLFMRDQGAKEVESTLTDLATTNAELQQVQKIEEQKPISDRLTELGFDADNLWTKEPCENEPYCVFTKYTKGEKNLAVFQALERWDGFYSTYEDENVACDMFVTSSGNDSLPIRLDLLAKVEQNLLEASTESDPVGVTVYRTTTEESPHTYPPTQECENPAYILNVHFE